MIMGFELFLFWLCLLVMLLGLRDLDRNGPRRQVSEFRKRYRQKLTSGDG
jgi:hypothetical protein